MAFRSSMTHEVINSLLQQGVLEVSRPDGDGSGESVTSMGTSDAIKAVRSRLSAERIEAVIDDSVTAIQERQAYIAAALDADPEQASEGDYAIVLDYFRMLRALLILLELREYASHQASVMAAAAELRSSGDIVAPLMPQLVDGLQSSWWHVSNVSNQLLRKIDAAAVPALINALQKLGRSNQHAVLDVLEDLAESAAPAVPTLCKLLADDEESGQVRGNRVIRVLGSIGKSASPAVPALLQILVRYGEDDSEDDASAAIAALYNIGEPAIPGLCEILNQSPKAFLRERAIKALNANLPDAAAALQVCLLDEDEVVRVIAALQLAQHGLATTPGVLETLLSYESGGLSCDVARALARMASHGDLADEQLVVWALMEWIRWLGSDDSWESNDAVVECFEALDSLGQSMPDDVIPMLLEQIKDSHPGELVARMAIDSLARFGAVAVPHLIELMEQSPDRLESAFDALIEIELPAALPAIPVVSRCLTDHSEGHIRYHAALVLKRLGARTPEAVAALVDRLDDSDSMVARIAGEALAALPKPVAYAPSVVELYLQGKIDAESLLDNGGIESDDIVDRLLGQLTRPMMDPAGQASALRRLAALASQSVPVVGDQLQPVIEALSDHAPAVRDAAALVLCKLAEYDSSLADQQVDDLIAYVRRRDAKCRDLALETLGKVNSEAAVAATGPVLKAFATKSDPNRCAIISLSRIGSPVAASLIPVLQEMVLKLIDADGFSAYEYAATIGRVGLVHGPELVTPLAQALVNRLDVPNPFVYKEAGKRYHIARALGAIGSPAADEAIPALLTCLLDPESDPRCAAATALGQIGAPAVHASVPLLIGSLLVDDSSEVRDSAAEGLGKIGSPAADCAVPALIKALEGEYEHFERCHDNRWNLKCKYHPDPRSPVLALGRIGAPAAAAIPTLIRGLLDERYAQGQNPAPWFIAETLALIGSPLADAAIPALIHTMDSDQFLAIFAANTLARLSSPAKHSAIPALLRHISDSDPRIRTSVCKALGSMGTAAQHCLPHLRECLLDRSWHVRRAASDAVKQIENLTETNYS